MYIYFFRHVYLFFQACIFIFSGMYIYFFRHVYLFFQACIFIFSGIYVYLFVTDYAIPVNAGQKIDKLCANNCWTKMTLL